jgi:predicted nucleotidyltransferase
MNPVEKKVLDAFKLLIQKRLSLHRIELFGSRARGDADPDSDMDVLVIAGDLSPELEDYVSECAWEAGFEYGIVLVPVVFTREEWETGPERYSLLAEAIKADGVQL